MAANSFGALCAAPSCTRLVEPGEGTLVHRGKKWLVYCQSHAPIPETDAGTAQWSSGHVFPMPRHREDRSHDALAAFLHARLEEEDDIAGAAWITSWRRPSPSAWVVVDDHDEPVAQCKEAGVARHMATWNPLRVLDQVSARLLIIDAYEDAPARSPQRQALRRVLCMLTLPYAHHPEWDEAWGSGIS